MLTILFAILMIAVFGKLILFAFKVSWGIIKILLFLVFLPVILIGIFAAGLVSLAFPLLIIVGIVTLIKTVIK